MCGGHFCGMPSVLTEAFNQAGGFFMRAGDIELSQPISLSAVFVPAPVTITKISANYPPLVSGKRTILNRRQFQVQI